VGGVLPWRKCRIGIINHTLRRAPCGIDPHQRDKSGFTPVCILT
jgi:hypothetical protein